MGLKCFVGVVSFPAKITDETGADAEQEREKETVRFGDGQDNLRHFFPSAVLWNFGMRSSSKEPLSSECVNGQGTSASWIVGRSVHLPFHHRR